jgi:membrane protein YqaA with SNARE-associated domain
MYDWVLSWADSAHGLAALVILSFAESSFFPVPPDVLLIALVLGATTKWWRFALWCTVASVVGGVFGYGIGVFAWETVGRWIVEHVAHMELIMVEGRADVPLPEYLHRFGGAYLFQLYDRWNAWIVFIFGLTPLPYKLVTITAGVARVNFPVFIAASIVGRATRFFAVALVLRLWGDHAKRFIDKYFNWLCILFVILLVGGFAVLKFVL